MTLFAILFACSPDLPAGWEDAEPVTSLFQAECDGNPYEDYATTVDATLGGDPVSIEVGEAHFRCAQDVEGYYRMEGETLEVLVQPIDMKPGVVAACDCLYDLSIEVAGVQATSVDVYRRWDALNEPNDPVLMGSAE